MPLYHLTMTRLREGSIIEPGNWGRLVRKYENATLRNSQFGGNLAGWIIARELVLELERVKNFNGLPSRFDSSFSFRDAENVERYRLKNDIHKAQVLHEIEFVEPAAVTHEASVSLLDWPPPDHSFLTVMGNMAAEYWKGAVAGDVREVVSASALRVLRSVE